MANQERTFEAGGKIYALRFSQNAIYRLEEKLGGESIFGMKIKPSTLQTMLWAGLEGARLKLDQTVPANRKPYTIDDAGDIIDELGGLAEATPIIMDAWTSSLAHTEKEKEGGSEAPGNPTKA
jgi:hypothetical protein